MHPEYIRSEKKALLSSSTDEDPIVLIVKNQNHQLSNEIAEQMAKALGYAKIPVQTIDLGILKQDLEIPETVRLICITTTELDNIKKNEIEDLVRFTSSGNTLLFGLPVWDRRFGYLEGIKKDSDYSVNTTASEFIFNENLFPDFKNAEYPSGTSFKHRGIDGSEFVNNARVIVSAKNEPEYPVILENSIGLGNTILFNTSFLYEKTYRGLLFAVMSRSLSGIPYPVANVSTIFLDDFPAPVYNDEFPPIDEEYDLTHAKFYTDIWWPDMKAFADTFNIDYTAVVAFNYNANVVPPFDFKEWELGEGKSGQKGSVWLARDVADSRHEMAFHGYNHFSLMHRNWSGSEFMLAAVQAAKKRWVLDDLGSLPVTYIPPNNEVDSAGLASVKKGFPSLEYMSSLYIGQVEDGEGREFGPDPYVPGLFNYPRISSGFYNQDNSVFEQNALYQHTGIWTHFIHPDDVFQIVERDDDEFANRNPLGLGWHSSADRDYGLYELFRKRIIETGDRYPLIRYKTAKDAAPIVQDWLYSSLEYNFNGSTISYQLDLNGKPFLSTSVDSTTQWFMFADEKHAFILEESVKKIADRYAISEYWRGKLFQFSVPKDSLVLPDFHSGSYRDPGRIKSEQSSVLADYHSYIADETDDQADITDAEKMEIALQELSDSPNSTGAQEKVIKLALEQGEVELAVNVLRQRLLNQQGNGWQHNDITRLFTYYGWLGEVDDAWLLIEQLWTQNQNQAVISAKNQLVQMYGYPDEETRERWLERELTLDPDNESTIRAFVTLNQSKESWSRTKGYLKELIKLHPRSDSLYHYTLQRSFYYDEPEETIELLNNFPESAKPQLRTLASEIAHLYAYSAGNYSEALEWSESIDGFPARTELEWLLQQKRYNAFMQKGDRYLALHPGDDSLRIFFGQQLIYEGFYDQGYEKLYPLFQKDMAPVATRRLVHTEVGYKSYEEKKSFYGIYPAFFSDSLKLDLQKRYRLQEGAKAGLSASYASDNFDNNIGRTGLFTEWGNRQSYTHHIALEEIFLGSDVTGTGASDQLMHLNYRYRRKYREQSMQSTLGGGLYYNDGKIKANAELGFWYAKDSTFTSGEVTLEPVLTNSAVQQEINQYKLSVYREDFWAGGKIQTTITGSGNYYTDEVFSFETLGRAYVQLPFSTARWRYRGVAELSYSDASTSYTNGIPYYTPDNLLIEGAGFDFRYRDLLQNPDLSVELELVGKNDSRDGLFLTSAARLNARIEKYWELSLNTEISSSSVYRYNNFGFTLSYIFPRKLPE